MTALGKMNRRGVKNEYNRITFGGCCGCSLGRWVQVVQWVKNLPAVQKIQEMWVQSLSGKDPLAKEMATHSSVLAWKIPWIEEPGGLQSIGSQRVSQNWGTEYTHTHMLELLCCIAEINTTWYVNYTSIKNFFKRTVGAENMSLQLRGWDPSWRPSCGHWWHMKGNKSGGIEERNWNERKEDPDTQSEGHEHLKPRQRNLSCISRKFFQEWICLSHWPPQKPKTEAYYLCHQWTFIENLPFPR